MLRKKDIEDIEQCQHDDNRDNRFYPFDGLETKEREDNLHSLHDDKAHELLIDASNNLQYLIQCRCANPALEAIPYNGRDAAEQ